MDSKPVILVTGKNGQLGSELQLAASFFPKFSFVFTDRSELDIAGTKEVDRFFTTHKIKFCINAAAYTGVDKAETEQNEAMKINAEAVKHLAVNCRQHNAHLIHISTDYVFDGTATSPYVEDHPTNPVNFYGLTKLQGEILALENLPSSILIRTSWVYSSFGNNFVKTMLRLMSLKDSLNVVDDQLGSPTYAADLANAIMQVVSQIDLSGNDHGGIYHYSNEGIISWYEFATAIKEIAGKACVVNPIPSRGFPTPAKRPGYSGMSKEKIQRTFNIQPLDWKDSLKTCLHVLNKQ